MEKLTVGKDPSEIHEKLLLIYSRHLQHGQRSAKMADEFCLHVICLPFTA